MFSPINLKNMAALALVIACSYFSSPAFAQDGTLDNSFGINGKAITNISGTGDMGRSVALQTGGKIILGGTTTFNSRQYIALVRYLTNGTVDSSFGTNGRAVAGFDSIGLVNLSAIKVQQDDKIVATGYSTGGHKFALIRFNANGTVDSAFGINGRVVHGINDGIAVCSALNIQSDGKILAAGYAGCDIAVCRYKTNGKLDSSFGLHGIKIIDAGGCDKANAIAIQTDKKIVIAGNTSEGALGHFLVVRININGKVDSTFGTNGKATTDIRQTYNEAFSCVIQADGKIVVGGLAKYFATAFGIARFNSNGIIDSAFGTFGKSELQFPGDKYSNNYPYDVALQADGKIIFAGWINDRGTLEVAVARYKTNGILDSTFGINGTVTTGNGNGYFGYTVAIQNDAKILVGGYAYYASTGNDFAVTRYNITSVVLPVKLSSFTANAVKSTVELAWSTASEVNSSHFIIERGTVTNSFTAIGKVNSAGNSSRLQQYGYSDMNPLKGYNFYRLKQVDKDGQLSYSKVVRVVFGNTPYIKAYPNPSRTSVKVGGLNAGSVLSVINIAGKVIGQYKTTGSDYTINVQNLAAGIYFIHVQQGGELTTLKLVKE
jgi:uncharacterized delta-60 repeat protein